MDTIDLLKGSRQDGLFDEVNSVLIPVSPKDQSRPLSMRALKRNLCTYVEPLSLSPSHTHACTQVILVQSESAAISRMCGMTTM